MSTDQSNAPEGQEQDPLSQAAGGIDTTIPLLAPDRTLRLECMSSQIAPTKSDESRNTLTVILKTTKDATFADGKPARAGYKLYKRWGVSETPGGKGDDGKERAPRTNKEIARDLALVLKCFFGANTTVTPRELLNNPAMLEGKVVDGKITIEKGSGGYADKNGVNLLIPA
jgi:hypothetical protein